MASYNVAGIQQEAKDLGWELLTDEYKNLQTEMEWRCPKGHLLQLTYDKWRTKHYCPECVKETSRIDISDKIPPKTGGCKRILALDDATKETGWAIFDGTTLIGYGVARRNNPNTIIRILQMKEWLVEMLEKWQPDFVAIEDIQLQISSRSKNVVLYKVLAQLQGVLLVTLQERGYEYTIVHSATWKSHANFVSRTRTDQKREARLRVKDWYGVVVTQDEADAICMGRYVAEKYLPSEAMLHFE